MSSLTKYFLILSRKGIRVNEMLKEIRAALRKCRDSNDALELSARSRE